MRRVNMELSTKQKIIMLVVFVIVLATLILMICDGTSETRWLRFGMF